MPHLAVYLLDTPRLVRDGVVVTVDTRKAVALLAFLAITHQQHSRDRLVALLWPDYDQSQARTTLRRTLYTLHQALPGEWLHLEREMIGLNPNASFWLDVDAFATCLAACRTHGHPAAEVCPACLQPLAEAVALYQGDFMAGFSLRDSPNFDDWQFFQAESLRRELAGALERLVVGYTAQSDYHEAIRVARRWLALDRLHEPAQRQLMQLYAWANQRAAALHQYRECVQILEQELGVAPLESTTQLYQAIKENHPPPLPVPWQTANLPSEEKAPGSLAMKTARPGTLSSLAALSPMPHTATEYPLIGRSGEWAVLLKAFTESVTNGQMVMIEGEAGIGKTRLAEEFVAEARSKGATVLAARCYEGETHLAYGPIIEMIRTALSQQGYGRWIESLPALWLSEAARLAPELTTLRSDLPAPAPLESPGAQNRFFEGLRQVLLALCSSAPPGVMVIDDVHWADAASLDLLIYLMRRLRQYPLCLVVTWRNEQATTRQHLRRLLVEARQRDNVALIALARLSQSNVGELLQAFPSVTRKLHLGIAGRLYRETEGLPFFLMEYLKALETGILPAEKDAWSLPGGMRDLLHTRLAAVSEMGQQLLSAAASIGRSFDFDTLREVSGRGEEETITELEALMAQGVVAEVQGAVDEHTLAYDFSHEKLRELIYEETSLARRRLLHRRVAEALVARAHGSPEDNASTGQIARHYRLAGNEAVAANYALLAGERARRLYANTEALEHFRMALALGHQRPARLHAAIGDLQTLLGEYSAALRSYETAAALSEANDLASIEHKLAVVYERRGAWELAESHFEAALAALGEGGQAEERSSIYADWSRTSHHRGQLDQALEQARQALDLAVAAQDTRALAQAHNLLGILASSQGDLEGARGHLEESLALAEQLSDLGIRAAALNNLALTYGANGAAERALELAEAALALCVAQGDRHREAALRNNLADLLHNAGRTEAAMAHLKQAVSIYADIDSEGGSLQPEIWKLTEW